MSDYKFNGNGLAFTGDDSKKRPRIVKKALVIVIPITAFALMLALFSGFFQVPL